MSLRETLENKKAIVLGVAGTLILIAAVSLAYQTHEPQPSAPQSNFYTVDDGATWFTDSVDKIPPFDHNGKMAVRAFVFNVNGAKSVKYMWRYTPQTRDNILAAQQKKSPGAIGSALQAASMFGLEVKKPGDAKWLLTTKNRKETDAMMRITGAVTVDP